MQGGRGRSWAHFPAAIRSREARACDARCPDFRRCVRPVAVTRRWNSASSEEVVDAVETRRRTVKSVEVDALWRNRCPDRSDRHPSTHTTIFVE